MAIRRQRTIVAESKTVLSPNERKAASRKKLRQHLMESLEPRQLMAVGPQLIGVQPNNSDLLIAGDVRQVAPRELVFRFDDSKSSTRRRCRA